MPELKLEEILSNEKYRELYGLESRQEFYVRVEESISILSLDCKPYDVTRDIIERVWDIVKAEPCCSRIRASELYNWVIRNIAKDFDAMGTDFRNYSFRSASETFRARRGACVDFAFLYTTMARVAGFEAYFVNVNEDYKGRTFAHACSGIYLKDSKQLILVDPASGGFDVKHRKFIVLNDNEVRRFWEEYCLSWNSGDVNGYLSAADNFSIGVDEPNNPSDFFISRGRLKDVAVASTFLFSAFIVGSNLDSFFDYFRSHTTNVVKREITEEFVRSDRERRFEYLVDILKRESPDDDNLNYVLYPDDFLYVSRKYIEYKKRRLNSEHY